MILRPTLSFSLLVFMLGVCPVGPCSDAVVHARSGAVVSAHPLASQAGLEILKAGGNSVDAAVAVAFALAVVHPAAGNLGGGGFLVVWIPGKGPVALDFRETAPAGAHRDMYLGKDGKPDKEASLYGPLAAGVPGSPAGLLTSLKKWGTLPRRVVMAPAIRLAQDGFLLDPPLARSLAGKKTRKRLERFTSTKALFYPGGKAMVRGTLFRQPDLAKVLVRIREGGRGGFYSGETAKLIVAACQQDGGIISLQDLANYQPVERKPLTLLWRGYQVVSMPPPSSGGACLAQMLNFVAPHFPQKKKHVDLPGAGELSVMADAMRLAFADRAAWMGDPGFFPVPLKGLLAPKYLQARGQAISPVKRLPPVQPGRPAGAPKESGVPGGGPKEGSDTTHLSVVDRWGGAASMTTTINSGYGSKYVVPGAGFLLNNEMDDFSVCPGTPNQFGLIGGRANEIVPGKRMLSSMTPTIVTKDGKVSLVLGSPGGPRIITTVFQVIMNRLVFDMDLYRAVTWPRIHQQWRPQALFREKFTLSPEVRTSLEKLGWELKVLGSIGRCQAIGAMPGGGWIGVTDLRGSGGVSGY